MNNSPLKNLLSRPMTRKEFLGLGAFTVASLFGVTAVARQLLSHAATPHVSIEPETGTVSTPAGTVIDSSASGGKAISFSASTITPGAPGTYKPTAATTGVKAGTSLTTYTGPTTITTAGTIIENKLIDKYLTINAANVIIRNCEIVGGTSWTGTSMGLIDARPGGVINLLVEDCTIHAQVPNVYMCGLMGHHFTMQRCEIYHTVDGIGIYNNNAGVKDQVYANVFANYIHDFSFFSPDPDHASTDNVTHNDGIQLHGGSHTVFRGNSFEWFAAKASDFPVSSVAGGVYQSALKFPTMLDATGSKVAGTDATATAHRGTGQCIYMSVITAPITDLIIEKNWFSGGGSQIGAGVAGVTIRNNFFNKDGKAYTSGTIPSRYQIRTTAAVLPTLVGVYTNTFETTGVALAVGNNRDDGIRTN